MILLLRYLLSHSHTIPMTNVFISPNIWHNYLLLHSQTIPITNTLILLNIHYKKCMLFIIQKTLLQWISIIRMFCISYNNKKRMFLLYQTIIFIQILIQIQFIITIIEMNVFIIRYLLIIPLLIFYHCNDQFINIHQIN